MFVNSAIYNRYIDKSLDLQIIINNKNITILSQMDGYNILCSIKDILLLISVNLIIIIIIIIIIAVIIIVIYVKT